MAAGFFVFVVALGGMVGVSRILQGIGKGKKE
jgi:hypothetical protein